MILYENPKLKEDMEGIRDDKHVIRCKRLFFSNFFKSQLVVYRKHISPSLSFDKIKLLKGK